MTSSDEQNRMNGEKLYGFIGDITGNENSLVVMDAVSEHEGTYYHYANLSNTDSCPMVEGDLKYVHTIPAPEKLDWLQGDKIVLVGGNLKPLMGEFITGELGYKLVRVPPNNDYPEYWLTSGSYQNHSNQCSRIVGELSAMLRMSILTQEDRERTEKLWALYKALSLNVPEASPERSLNAILYYDKVAHNPEKTALEIRRAVLNGSFENPHDVEQAYQELLAL